MFVLVVENHAATAYLHKRGLEAAGHQVVIARDAVDAQGLLGDCVFDAVVADYDLEHGPSGAEVLLEVRTRYPHARRVLYSRELPWRMKLAAQAVANTVLDQLGSVDELVDALAVEPRPLRRP